MPINQDNPSETSDVELKPCRACGAPCEVVPIKGKHIQGECFLWACSQNERLGGNCPDDNVYLTAEAWNARTTPEAYTGPLVTEEMIEAGVHEAEASAAYGYSAAEYCKNIYLAMRSVSVSSSHGPHCSNYRQACRECLDKFDAWKRGETVSACNGVVEALREMRGLFDSNGYLFTSGDHQHEVITKADTALSNHEAVR